MKCTPKHGKTDYNRTKQNKKHIKNGKNTGLSDIDDLNYFNIPVDFSGKIIIMNTNSRSIYLNTIFNGESKNKDLIAKAPAVCYEIIELFDTGPPRPTGIKFCDTSGNVENLSTSSPNYPQHGGNRGGSSTSSTDNYKITANLTGKAKCVYDKLNITSNKFKNAIQKFDGDFPVSHLRFSMDYKLPNTTSAVTNNSNQNIIEIRINGNVIPNRTILGMARTFAHEVIHAELYRKVRSVGGVVSVNDFPGIYDYYKRHIKNWQHEQMAAHYRGTIADVLQDFDNNQHTRQFYLDIAWEGLHKTTSWGNLQETERKRIESIITNYKKTGNKTCN